MQNFQNNHTNQNIWGYFYHVLDASRSACTVSMVPADPLAPWKIRISIRIKLFPEPLCNRRRKESSQLKLLCGVNHSIWHLYLEDSISHVITSQSWWHCTALRHSSLSLLALLSVGVWMVLFFWCKELPSKTEVRVNMDVNLLPERRAANWEKRNAIFYVQWISNATSLVHFWPHIIHC